MKTIVRTGIAVALACVWAGLGGAAEYYNQSAQAGKSSDGAVILYGKVVDQNDKPVYKAQITAGREYLSLGTVRFFGTEIVRAETDADGAFTFTGNMIKKLIIKSIEKRGCETLQNEKGVKTFSYDEGSQEPLFKPDPAKPVVFVLQKNFDAGLVDNKKARLLIRTDAEGFTVDLLKGFSDAMEKISAKKAARDIVVRFTPSQDKQSRIMTISAPGAKNGLADKDGAPHIAPAGNYAPALAYQIPLAGQASKVIVYHKGRGGKLYSRLELELVPADNGIRVSAGLFTNIEGGQNTDFDSFHTEEEIVRLTGKKLSYGGSAYREAISAIVQNTIQ
jgi:hypothetical protein